MSYDQKESLKGNLLRLLPPHIGLDGSISHEQQKILSLFGLDDSIPYDKQQSLWLFGLDDFIPHAQRQISLLFGLAHQSGFTFDGVRWTSVPSEIWYRIIFFLIYSIPNRGLCPIKLVQTLNDSTINQRSWVRAYLYGSSIVNRFTGGNWYPQDWDFGMPGQLDTTAIDEMILFLGVRQGNVRFVVENSIHQKVIVGPYAFDIVRSRDFENDLDLTKITYHFHCEEYRFKGDFFPGNYFRARAAKFRHVSEDIAWGLTSRGLTLEQIVKRLNCRSRFVDKGIDKFLEIQDTRFQKYKDRLEKDGIILEKVSVTCPMEARTMIMDVVEYTVD